MYKVTHLGRDGGKDLFIFGSAYGPGGLRARLGRHLRGIAKPHWHIDVLRAVAQVEGFCYLPGLPGTGMPVECHWSQALAMLPGVFQPAPGFSASDCHAGCRAHLVGMVGGRQIDTLRELLANTLSLPVESLVSAVKSSL